MNVFFIRHGSTAGNLEHRYVGTTDEPITDEAAEQLRLMRMRLPDVPLVAVSPLQRCRQTASLLYPAAEQLVLSGLRECDFGRFEYRNYEELQEDAAYQSWIDSGGSAPFPGGESREAFCGRCCEAFEAACRAAEERGCESLAFVVHGGTIMAVLDRFSAPHADYFSWQVKNGCGYRGRLSRSPDGWQVKELTPLLPEDEPIGIEEQFVLKKNKKLRCGYTTGSCAAGAAKAAAQMLLGQKLCSYVDVMTPKGVVLHLPVLDARITPDTASCAVRKYGGDDPDATDGLLIYATVKRMDEEARSIRAERGAEDEAVEKACSIHAERGAEDEAAEKACCMHKERGTEDEAAEKACSIHVERGAEEKTCCVHIDGGAGVGRVTKPGLEQPVGAAAINRVPRRMIVREVEAVCEEQSYFGEIAFTISVPGGAQAAKKTFNPHLGIVGGISILGTGGIVVPMSEEALLASIRVEMKQKCENGEEYLLITPGNYGADFIRKKELSHALDAAHSMKCSNYVGETLDMAAELGVKGILFVAHIGKFCKVSGGIMNTHSASADCRAELIAAQAMRALRAREEADAEGKAQEPEDEMRRRSAAFETVQRLLDANTTEEAVDMLAQAQLLDETVAEMLRRILFHLQKHCRGALETEVVLFSNRHGYLGETEGAERMMERIVKQKEQEEHT